MVARSAGHPGRKKGGVTNSGKNVLKSQNISVGSHAPKRTREASRGKPNHMYKVVLVLKFLGV